LKLKDIAEKIGARIRGDGDCEITGIASLENAAVGDVSFLSNNRYRGHLRDTHASAVILREQDADEFTGNVLIMDQPSAGYGRAALLLAPERETVAGTHGSAVISPSASIADSASIGPYCVIEDDVHVGARVDLGPGCTLGAGCVVGDDSRLVARVTVCAGSQIGKRAVLHPGVVIGADGFGLTNENGIWKKIPQLGHVVLGDDVEIGANSCVDRGALKPTRIGNGVKIDNLVQVAHNVVIGDHCAIAGCVGIAGSARLGKRCSIGGGVGILGHVDITDDVMVTGMTFVSKSIDKAGIYSSGSPLETNQQWRRNMVRMKKLDELAKKVAHLEKQMHGKKG